MSAAPVADATTAPQVRALALLPAICGPTAAGKSALALALAQAVGGAILSADSRQLYRGFDLGTAKPTPAERARVPHYGVDVAAPTERWSAARWADDALAWAADARGRGLAPLLVGGTGFYLRALDAPLFDEPPLDPAERARLDAVIGRLPVPELRRWVERLDPARAHLQRTQLLRAIEVALLTGTPLSAWHARAPRPPRARLRYLVVDPGPVLVERIARRVDAMLDAGWVDEVRALAGHVPPDAPAWNASGYDAVREHVEGSLTLAGARERIVVETRRYAKRQRTWFRHQLPAEAVVRVDPDDPRALDVAHAWWDAVRREAEAGVEPRAEGGSTDGATRGTPRAVAVGTSAHTSDDEDAT